MAFSQDQTRSHAMVPKGKSFQRGTDGGFVRAVDLGRAVRRNLRLLDVNHNCSRVAVRFFVPVVFSEHAQRLGDGFVETLRSDFDCMLDPSRIAAAHPAHSNRHENDDNSFVFSSPYEPAKKIPILKPS